MIAENKIKIYYIPIYLINIISNSFEIPGFHYHWLLTDDI